MKACLDVLVLNTVKSAVKYFFRLSEKNILNAYDTWVKNYKKKYYILLVVTQKSNYLTSLDLNTMKFVAPTLDRM